VMVVQDARMVFANPSMVRIVGHPLEHLRANDSTSTVHPDDVAAMVDRHERRLRGEPVEMFYGFRGITQTGKVRSLELPAVKIDWDKRPTTLQHYDDRMPANRKRQTLEKIDVAVERMMHMLENVLVIGRHDAGQLEFRPRPLAITPFCIGLIEKLSSTMVTALNPNPQHCRQPVDQRIQVFGPCKPRALFCNRAARRVGAQGLGPGYWHSNDRPGAFV
ncbi:MAG: hypothetical protein RLZZ573_743, partial [Pseudomonadota bacterium]